MAVSVICNSGHAGIEYYFYGWLTSGRRVFNISGSRDVHIVINEVMAMNHTGITDEDGDRGDWIELYNPGVMPVNLSGYGV